MKIIDPSFEIEPFDEFAMNRAIEKAGRTCYNSSAEKFKEAKT